MNIYENIIKQIGGSRQIALKSAFHGTSGKIAENCTREFVVAEPTADSRGRLSTRVSVKTDDEVITVTEPFMPPERLIILGGGHVALPVCEIGAKCGFMVCVADDRQEFANYQRFPMANTVLCDSFENAIRRFAVTSFDYVVVVTRGHRSDADCLRAILPGTMPAYLGMIGSRRRVKALLELLAEEGFDEGRLKQICTPIGLNIGAVTPDEIAVSIMAEIISYRRLPEYAAGNRFCNDSDVEIPVLEYLAENTEPEAIVTVLETKGSTPRRAGAKMAVSPLGKTMGSIGGGCSEAAVIKEAVKLIGTGRYMFYDIDMTGDVAENDGMVCGGIMRVLIEDALG